MIITGRCLVALLGIVSTLSAVRLVPLQEYADATVELSQLRAARKDYKLDLIAPTIIASTIASINNSEGLDIKTLALWSLGSTFKNETLQADIDIAGRKVLRFFFTKQVDGSDLTEPNTIPEYIHATTYDKKLYYFQAPEFRKFSKYMNGTLHGHSQMERGWSNRSNCFLRPFTGIESFELDDLDSYHVGVYETSLCWFKLDKSHTSSLLRVSTHFADPEGYETLIPKNGNPFHNMALAFHVVREGDKFLGQMFLIDLSGSIHVINYELTKKFQPLEHEFGWTVSHTSDFRLTLSSLDLSGPLTARIDGKEISLTDKSGKKLYALNRHESKWERSVSLTQEQARKTADEMTRDYNLGFIGALTNYRDEVCFVRGVGSRKERGVDRCAGICCIRYDKNKLIAAQDESRLLKLLPSQLASDSDKYVVNAIAAYDYNEKFHVHIAYTNLSSQDIASRYGYYHCGLVHSDKNADGFMNHFPNATQHCVMKYIETPPVDFSYWRQSNGSEWVLAFYDAGYEYIDAGRNFVDGGPIMLGEIHMRDENNFEGMIQYHAAHLDGDMLYLLSYANTVIKYQIKEQTASLIDVKKETVGLQSEMLLKFDRKERVIEALGRYLGYNQRWLLGNKTFFNPGLTFDSIEARLANIEWSHEGGEDFPFGLQTGGGTSILWIIVMLVVAIIILACIGFCCYSRWSTAPASVAPVPAPMTAVKSHHFKHIASSGLSKQVLPKLSKTSSVRSRLGSDDLLRGSKVASTTRNADGRKALSSAASPTNTSAATTPRSSIGTSHKTAKSGIPKSSTSFKTSVISLSPKSNVASLKSALKTSKSHKAPRLTAKSTAK